MPDVYEQAHTILQNTCRSQLWQVLNIKYFQEIQHNTMYEFGSRLKKAALGKLKKIQSTHLIAAEEITVKLLLLNHERKIFLLSHEIVIVKKRLIAGNDGDTLQPTHVLDRSELASKVVSSVELLLTCRDCQTEKTPLVIRFNDPVTTLYWNAKINSQPNIKYGNLYYGY